MPKLTLTIGASASGKTTWADEYINSHPNTVNINRDDVRFELFTGGVRDWNLYKFTKKRERDVTDSCEHKALKCVEGGMDIIISDTNLNPSVRENWREFAEGHEYDYEEKLFPCEWSELVKRNNQRQGGISQNILWSQYKRYMQQFGVIGELPVIAYKHNDKLPDTLIVDIDGTVADMTGVRKPFDWDKVGMDNPRQEVIEMIIGLANYTGNIIFMSGRDGSCYYDTLDWIERHVMQSCTKHIKWDLIMREMGDSRKDWIVKYELYMANVHDKYNVSAVFDDRAQVLRLWDLIDLPNVINVGGYSNEF